MLGARTVLSPALTAPSVCACAAALLPMVVVAVAVLVVLLAAWLVLALAECSSVNARVAPFSVRLPYL